jgi:hypothetical protein
VVPGAHRSQEPLLFQVGIGFRKGLTTGQDRQKHLKELIEVGEIPLSHGNLNLP